MTVIKTVACLMVLWITTAISAAATLTDLTIIDIDGIGPQKLAAIKQHQRVDWWLEMGDKLVASLNGPASELPVGTAVITQLRNIDTSRLVIEKSAHCSAVDDHRHHQTPSQGDPNKPRVLISSGGYHISDASAVLNKARLMTSETIMPFVTNQVLIYQINNRKQAPQKAAPALAGLLDQVDADRWFDQVVQLASHDRMSDAGMEAAGEWLEQRFMGLGLNTSRLDPFGRNGFTVLGFKNGTVTPDDWYVVGAHLDSRNWTWNPGLPSPGAEDNASGCSGVLEMANVLSAYDTDSSILFACFNAEETGFWGSAELIGHFRQTGALNNIKFMQNMDMISYHQTPGMMMNAGTDNADDLTYANQLASYGNQFTDINWQVNPNDCCTDFISFTAAGIPAVSSTISDVFGYFAYHRSNDLPENLDKVQGAGVVKANLALLADLAGVQLASETGLNAGHSGMWYNPEQPGHGVTVEVLDNDRIMVVWYVYDPMGQQIWLVGSGPRQGNTATVEVGIYSQGLFPPEFDATTVVEQLWGTLTLEFADCQSATMSWQPADGTGYPAGSTPLSRLTSIAGLSCESAD